MGGKIVSFFGFLLLPLYQCLCATYPIMIKKCFWGNSEVVSLQVLQYMCAFSTFIALVPISDKRWRWGGDAVRSLNVAAASFPPDRDKVCTRWVLHNCMEAFPDGWD